MALRQTPRAHIRRDFFERQAGVTFEGAAVGADVQLLGRLVAAFAAGDRRANDHARIIYAKISTVNNLTFAITNR